MAKKTETVKEKESDFKDIVKKYGDVISSGKRVFDRRKDLKTLSISPCLDLGLGGGIIEGSWFVISGPPKSCKTTVALQTLANAQKMGRPGIYVDVECRLKNHNLVGIEGLDLGLVNIIHSPPEGPMLSGEDYLDILENLMKRPENNGAVIILDSSSSLVPRSELDAGVSGNIRNNLAKMLSHFIKKNAQTVVQNKLIFIIIRHYITNTTGYGKKRISDSGVMAEFQADTLLDVKTTEDWIENEKLIGMKTLWTISCSSVGSHNSECTTHFRFNKGLDKVSEILDISISLGLVDKASSWYTISFMSEIDENYDEKNYKFQGITNLYNYLNENKEVYQKLESRVKEMLS